MTRRPALAGELEGASCFRRGPNKGESEVRGVFRSWEFLPTPTIELREQPDAAVGDIQQAADLTSFTQSRHPREEAKDA